MFGGKPTAEEEEYMKSLKNRMNTDIYSKDQLNTDIFTGTRGALGQFNDQVNEGKGTLFNQGMEDSVLTSQVGLKERVNIADGLNTTAIDATQKANDINFKAKREAEQNFYDLKSQLAQRRQDVSQGGFENLVGGATDAIGYHQEAKYMNSLGGNTNLGENVGSSAGYSLPTYDQSVRSGTTGRSSLKRDPKKKPLGQAYVANKGGIYAGANQGVNTGFGSGRTTRSTLKPTKVPYGASNFSLKRKK